ncbi:MAG: TonB-dependent receptor plug domain-containing protein [Gammaproteobacteria bacterium]|nr:TonB-dependent receptor plug domain-containing protein [Gammaproteobacteria bacterium]MYH47038.1 TonB-dependent receptor plug domain-containing protein [Gammaproteobacteria bacterium]MYL15005.1 TonB-dependent receptor plug domain-containing protein [Gammaproteobacteria bacterium]
MKVNRRSQGGIMKISYFAPFGIGALIFVVLAMGSGTALAQDDAGGEQIEEILVTGSQIRGAAINDALAVSVFSSEDIELLGVDGGDELLAAIPENGQNFFGTTDLGGGVNGARGDVGTPNLRALGTGNTLVLLNGRRMVNMATFQTEVVGGSFVPVNSVNSNHLPVFGLDRVEVLRDGASAIYGADAVAGVINTVTKDDFEGFTVRIRQTEYDHMPRSNSSLAVEWGEVFNGGRTSVGAFARNYSRDRVRSSDEARWANSDFRSRFPEDSPYRTSTVFRNNSINSLHGQFDIARGVGSSNSLRVNDIVDNSGEFEIFPSGSSQCANGHDTGYGTCMVEDGQGVLRFNLNEGRDMSPEIDRTTFFGYLNHEISDDLEFFADAYYYSSQSNRHINPSASLSAARLRVGAANHWNPLGPVGSPNRLPDSIVGPDLPPEGLELIIDNYRYAEVPRIVNNDGEAFRFLGGLRGVVGDWDWEAAGVYSEASRDDVTSNRISNTLMKEALFDSTPNAYNPFSGGVNSNLERALVDVYRLGKTSLASFDVKFSNPALFELPAGSVGFLVGYELRAEDYVDNRDPRLDGTIDFVDFEGEGYPFTSDVMNSSPTPDGAGERTTNSLFAEFQVPVHETLDVQLAARYESFDDIGDTTVGKFAFGWTPIEQFLLRGSVSTAFRAPNLITINEEFVARTNTRDDWVCFYGVDQGSVPADNDFSDCDYGMQRQATGSKDLQSEESLNTSIGFVLTPVDSLTVTADYWTIEKDDSIGLFGEENHILVDLVTRLAAGTSNCATVQGNPVVLRGAVTDDPVEVQGFLDAGLCPIGQVTAIQDTYANLDSRTLEGYDIGVYWDLDTDFGRFSLKWNGSYIEKFEQEPGGLTTIVQEAKASDPTIVYPIAGIGDLLNFNGNQDFRSTASLSFSRDVWNVAFSSNTVGDYFQMLSNGDRFDVPAFTRYNFKADYFFEVSGVDSRIRLGVNNFTDERAPLYDRSFGFDDDSHSDWGVYYYVDLMMQFGRN